MERPGIVQGYVNLISYTLFFLLFVFLVMWQVDVPNMAKIDNMARHVLLDQDGALASVQDHVRTFLIPTGIIRQNHISEREHASAISHGELSYSRAHFSTTFSRISTPTLESSTGMTEEVSLEICSSLSGTNAYRDLFESVRIWQRFPTV